MCRSWLRYARITALVVFATIPFVAWAQAAAPPAQENSAGQVIVKVTPLAVQAGAEMWRFEVQLTTHTVPLTQDLAAVSTLADGRGREVGASAWQGDPPGGHHRKGVLAFKPIAPMPESITLTIRGIGSVSERRFIWRLAAP